MKLVDVMSAAHLEMYAEIGLVIFAVAFAAVVAHALYRGNKADFDRASRLPLDEADARGA